MNVLAKLVTGELVIGELVNLDTPTPHLINYYLLVLQPINNGGEFRPFLMNYFAPIIQDEREYKPITMGKIVTYTEMPPEFESAYLQKRTGIVITNTLPRH